jgi:hypothetical protein
VHVVVKGYNVQFNVWSTRVYVHKNGTLKVKQINEFSAHKC